MVIQKIDALIMVTRLGVINVNVMWIYLKKHYEKQ